MCTDTQHSELLAALGTIYKSISRTPIENTIPISSSLPWIVDYRERKHIYLFSPQSVVLSCQEYGSLSIPQGLWVSADIPIGTRVTAPNQASSLLIRVLYTDSSIHQPILPGYGLFSTAIAAGVAANTVIKNSPGVLNSILVTNAGTSSLLVFDNASTNSGTEIGLVPSTATADGVPFVFNFPAANGITVQGNSNNPAVTITWT